MAWTSCSSPSSWRVCSSSWLRAAISSSTLMSAPRGDVFGGGLGRQALGLPVGTRAGQHGVEVVRQLHVASRQAIVAARRQVDAALGAADQVAVRALALALFLQPLDHAGQPLLR